MTGMRSLVASWWDNLSEQDQQRVRAASDTPVAGRPCKGLEEAGILTASAEWIEAPGSRMTFLPPAVRDYVDELDRDQAQG